MSKNKKLILSALLILPALLLGGVFAYQGFALEKYQTADAYGVKVSYPAEWKESPYQFHTAATTTQPGITVFPASQKVRVAISPAYTGALESEHPESSGLQAEAMLVSSTPLQNLPGVSVAQLVVHYYGGAGTSHYVAKDVLITDDQLQHLGLKHDKMTKINPDENIAIKPKPGQLGVAVGFNSQEPLTLGQAASWFKTPEAQAAHAILLSAEPNV